MTADFCETCAKVIFTSKEEADDAVAFIKEKGDEVELYRCPMGGGWHLRSTRE